MRSTGRRETGGARHTGAHNFFFGHTLCRGATARRGDDVRGTPPLRACSAQPTACRHPVPPVRMPPDAPTFLPVPPYASQYLRVATNLRSPFSEPVNLRMSLTNIHDRPHNLWSSPHHLRSFIGSATQMSGDSEIQCLGNSAIRCLGDSAIRRFGDSAIRRFGGSQPPPNNLRRNHGSFDLGPLSLIPAPASASPWS